MRARFLLLPLRVLGAPLYYVSLGATVLLVHVAAECINRRDRRARAA